MLYFIRDLETAAAESPLTAQAAQRYADWREVDRATYMRAWMIRDVVRLARMVHEAKRAAQEAAAVAVQERAVGLTPPPGYTVYNG